MDVDDAEGNIARKRKSEVVKCIDDPEKTFARPVLPPPRLSSELHPQPPRPATPEYSAFSPPPEDLYSDSDEDVKTGVDDNAEEAADAQLEIQSLKTTLSKFKNII